jgi:cytochrome c biogenesis protein ResB
MITKLYKFSASVKLAIPLMIILALAMIMGTFLESEYDTEVDKMIEIYKKDYI